MPAYATAPAAEHDPMPDAVLRLVQPSTMSKPQELTRWQRLARQASEPNPFLEDWYLLPALRAMGAMGANRVSLACLEANGNLLGLMPLARNWHYYGRPIPHLASWSHPNSFLGAPLVARGMEPVFWRALLSHADGHAGMALFLHLTHVPLEGALAEALRQVLTEEERPHGLVWREERAVLASPLSPEAYLEASLSGKKRKELRRQYARLSELGKVETIRQRDATDLAPWIEDFLALEAAGWKGAAGSALSCSPATAALFREALTGAAASDRLERLALRLDGRAIAMLASFVMPPMAFSYKTAFDESLSRYSPGVLLQRDNLSLLLDRDIAMTDSCASADHPMIDHLWRERRSVGRLSIAIGGRARQAAFGAVLRREQQVEW